MIKLKDKGLHKVSLFKNNFCKSWTYLPLTGQIVIHKDTQATNWEKYIKACNKCALEGTGYTIKLYKRGQGIKGATKLSFSNILHYNGKIKAKQFLNTRLQMEELGFKTY